MVNGVASARVLSPAAPSTENPVSKMGDQNEHRLPIRKTALALIGELGSESNAHGVARIVRSHDSRRKVVWSMLVLLGVGAAISQLSSLVHKYLQYQVVEVSEIQDGLPVEFPSVTVCNIEPISWRKLRELLNDTSNDSSDDSSSNSTSDVKNWLNFLDAFDFGDQEARLRSIRAFHENVGEDALYVRHSLNESLLHCSFNKQQCSTANFTTSFDGNYYSCFTFNTQPSDPSERLIVHATGPEHGLSVVMFLDNNEPPLGTYAVYTLDTNILHSAGARVMVHAPNTLPIPVDHGQDVAPGFSTSVAIKPYLHARLSHPYGNCSDGLLRGLSNFTSTFSTCIAVCKQELIARTCQCRSSVLPQLPALMHVPYCGLVPDWREMMRHQDRYNHSQHLPALQCEATLLDRLKNDRGYETDCGCMHPCGELTYHMSTSMSYWPTELYQFDALKELYGDSIETSPLKMAYKLHDINIKDGEEVLRQISQHGQPRHRHGSQANLTDPDASDSNRTANETYYEERGRNKTRDQPHSDPPATLEYTREHLDNLRKASTKIRQNLLRLNVYLEDLSVVKFKQMPAYGMEDLFADIGGILGLYMGVSVLTVMELLELVVRLSYLFLRAEWKPSGGPVLNDGGGGRDRDGEQGGGGGGGGGVGGGGGGGDPRGGADTRARSVSPSYDDPRHPGGHYHRYHPHHHPRNHGDGPGGGSVLTLDNDLHPYSGHHGGYSYRTDADFNRHPGEGGRDAFEMNGYGDGSSAPCNRAAAAAKQARPGYSGRTKYWRLKRGKSKM